MFTLPKDTKDWTPAKEDNQNCGHWELGDSHDAYNYAIVAEPRYAEADNTWRFDDPRLQISKNRKDEYDGPLFGRRETIFLGISEDDAIFLLSSEPTTVFTHCLQYHHFFRT